MPRQGNAPSITAAIAVFPFESGFLSVPWSCVEVHHARTALWLLLATASPRQPKTRQHLVADGILDRISRGPRRLLCRRGLHVYSPDGLQRATDAAALAAVTEMGAGEQAATDVALEYVVRNPYGPLPRFDGSQIETGKAEFLAAHGDDFNVEYGIWDSGAKQLVPPLITPAAVQVSVNYPDGGLFFAPVMGTTMFGVQASSVATFQPRDIVLVLDFSASMNNDSELQSIDVLVRKRWSRTSSRFGKSLARRRTGTCSSIRTGVTHSGSGATFLGDVAHQPGRCRGAAEHAEREALLRQWK